ncbi:MAG TPA: hypothetical protein VFB72_08340, partial [Verrucomicrobiae bacterium]|nr:hypothetical protein [Verrucomicrobiae bacterium]
AMLAAEEQKARVWRDGEWRLIEAVIFQIHALSLTDVANQKREEIAMRYSTTTRVAISAFRELQRNNVQRIKDVNVAFLINHCDIVPADGNKFRVRNGIFASVRSS